MSHGLGAGGACGCAALVADAGYAYKSGGLEQACVRCGLQLAAGLGPGPLILLGVLVSGGNAGYGLWHGTKA